jgi:hypothetical protein
MISKIKSCKMYVSFYGQHTHIAQTPRGAFFLLNKLTSNNGWTFIGHIYINIFWKIRLVRTPFQVN